MEAEKAGTSDSAESPREKSGRSESQSSVKKAQDLSSSSSARSNRSATSSSKPPPPKKQTKPKKAAEDQDEEDPNMCCGYPVSEIETHISALVDSYQPPPLEMRNPVVQLINRRRVAALIASDYDAAEEQDKIHEIYNYVMHLEHERLTKSNKIDLLFERWQQLQADQRAINEKWNKKMDAYMAEDQAKWDKMIEDQDREVAEHVEKWKDPKTLRQFNKPSGRLLQMREQEKHMAVTRMYQQARQMKAAADAVQREETEAAQKRMREQMALEKKRMDEKHEEDKQKHLRGRQRNLGFMEKERQQELKPIINAMTQIKAKKTGAGGVSKATMTRTRGKEERIETLSPRTQKKYATYKAEKKNEKLPLKPDERLSRMGKRSAMKKTQEQPNDAPKNEDVEKKSLSASEQKQELSPSSSSSSLDQAPPPPVETATENTQEAEEENEGEPEAQKQEGEGERTVEEREHEEERHEEGEKEEEHGQILSSSSSSSSSSRKQSEDVEKGAEPEGRGAASESTKEEEAGNEVEPEEEGAPEHHSGNGDGEVAQENWFL